MSYFLFAVVLCFIWHFVTSAYRDYNVDEGVLNIDRVYPDDAGTFVCSAQNDLGSNEKDYNLDVGGRYCKTSVVFACGNKGAKVDIYSGISKYQNFEN